MKKLLILIIAAALFLHFFPQPPLEKWYEKQKEQLIEAVSSLTDTKVRLKSEKILTDLAPELASFNTDEQSHLKEITATRATVEHFYTHYCQSNKRHFTFHYENQKKVCQAISRHASLLTIP